MCSERVCKIYCVYLDATHFKVKQDGAMINKAAYMVIGIDLDGNKDVLGMWIGENEPSVLAECAE